MRNWSGVAILLFVSACAGAHRNSADGRAAGDEGARSGSRGEHLVCKKERVMGSHMRQEVCHYEEMRARTREAAQDHLRPGSVNGPPPDEI